MSSRRGSTTRSHRTAPHRNPCPTPTPNPALTTTSPPPLHPLTPSPQVALFSPAAEAAPTIIAGFALPAPPRRWLLSCSRRPHTHDVRALAVGDPEAGSGGGPVLVSAGTDTQLCTLQLHDFERCAVASIIVASMAIASLATISTALRAAAPRTSSGANLLTYYGSAYQVRTAQIAAAAHPGRLLHRTAAAAAALPGILTMAVLTMEDCGCTNYGGCCSATQTLRRYPPSTPPPSGCCSTRRISTSPSPPPSPPPPPSPSPVHPLTLPTLAPPSPHHRPTLSVRRTRRCSCGSCRTAPAPPASPPLSRRSPPQMVVSRLRRTSQGSYCCSSQSNRSATFAARHSRPTASGWCAPNVERVRPVRPARPG